MKVKFTPKYGENTLEIPIDEHAKPSFQTGGFVNLFNQRVTIYNDLQGGVVEGRHFDRFVIPRCNVQGGYITRTDGAIQNIVNAKTVITKAVELYKTPSEYAALPVDERENYFTAQSGDLIVLDEVDDIVTTAAEFSALKKKYSANSLQIVSATAYIYGMDSDNVAMTNT